MDIDVIDPATGTTVDLDELFAAAARRRRCAVGAGPPAARRPRGAFLRPHPAAHPTTTSG